MMSELAESESVVEDPSHLKHVTIGNAVKCVMQLFSTPLPPNVDPDITAADEAVFYNADMDAKFTDRHVYMTCASKYVEEAVRQAELSKMLDEGQDFAAMLYTWRSCSLAIPAIKSNDQSNRLSIYEKTVEILEPYVDKLRHFMVYQKRTVTCFCEEVKRLCVDKSSYVSEAYLLTLGKFVSLFSTLDELKNIKASTKNDYSTYKRAADMLQRFHDPTSLEESRNMSMFLAKHNSILAELKLGLAGVPGSEDLMCDIVNACVNIYENTTYLTPSEKHNCVKAIGFTLYLVDSDKVNINRLDGKKKINLPRIDKIFKAEEVVPLYGDMMIGPFKYIERTPNYDPEKWEKCNSGTVSSEAEILKHMAEMRKQHAQLVCELALQRDRNCPLKACINPKKKYHPPDKDDGALYELALKTMKTLSNWTAKITQMFSWKLLHPTCHSDNRSCPEDAEEYERAIRYNFSSEEKNAITEVLAMIKGVQKLSQHLQEDMQDAIRRHLYSQLQELVQLQLREPMRKAIKNKKELVRSTLMGVRAISSHLAEGFRPEDDPLTTKLKKDSQTGFKVPLNKKAIAPSSTQLYLVRIMLESLVDKGDKSTGRKSPRKDIDSNHIQAMEQFLRASSFWPHLLNFNHSLEQCCDLSQLWYREFYLEMTKGARIQFPIDMSFPWILTNHILETSNHRMMQYLLYPLDLYNDSAHYALNVFHRSFLYEEVEAELNLVFDQFVYKLSEIVFRHYKVMASSMMLDKSFRTICQKHKFTIPPGPPPANFAWLFQQHHFVLLGREVDLRRLLTQRIQEAFLKSISAAIGRFESSDLTGVVELDALLTCNRLTHQLLSQHLTLDDFNTILQEANTSVTSPIGRITLYLFLEVNYDFLPQFCYNASTNRFVRTVYSFVDSVEREKTPSTAYHFQWGNKMLTECYKNVFSLYGKFIGPPHFQAMVRLLGYHEISLIIKQMKEVINSIISSQIVPLLETLKEVMPKRCKLPRYEYTSPGVLEYFQAQLFDIMNYSDLQPKVFQSFRELGNAVLFCLMLEQNLSCREAMDLNLAALFQHIIPKPYIPKTESTEEAKKLRDERMKDEIRKLDIKYKHQHVLGMIGKNGTEEQIDHAKSASVLTREKLCSGLSIFSKFLVESRKCLDNSPLWVGDSENRYDVMNNMEFHRLWSALQFVFCKPPISSNEFTIEMLFGEGLNWAGCTLIMLLGQQRRFQLMDYSYHLQKVHRVDQKDKDCKGVSLRKMVDRIRKFQILNDQIFSILEKYLLLATDRSVVDQNRVKILHMDPPQQEGQEEAPIYQEITDQGQEGKEEEEGTEQRQYAEAESVYLDDFDDEEEEAGVRQSMA